ncbi:hypothetical protein HMPREF1408_00889 [Helicobacter pylori GAM245Ai]|nr:hypothetical protein HMPREF1408_00889 [Helicobacter pylori GAM245Ai]
MGGGGSGGIWNIWFFYFLIIRIFYNMSATHKNISFYINISFQLKRLLL